MNPTAYLDQGGVVHATQPGAATPFCGDDKSGAPCVSIKPAAITCPRCLEMLRHARSYPIKHLGLTVQQCSFKIFKEPRALDYCSRPLGQCRNKTSHPSGQCFCHRSKSQIMQ